MRLAPVGRNVGRVLPGFALMVVLVAMGSAHGALVAHWPLDVGGADVAGGDHHLALKNGAAIVGAGIIGAGALGGSGADGNLDGLTDHAVADGSAGGNAYYGIPGSGPRTVSLWARGLPFAGGPYDNTPTLFSFGVEDIPDARYDIRLRADGQVRLEFSGAWFNFASPSVSDENWHHILVSSTTDRHSLYMDGKLRDTGFRTINTQTTWPVRVGDSILDNVTSGDLTWYTNRSFRGWIDDVALYDDADAGNADAGAAVAAALLNGLGRINGIGVGALPTAQDLWVNGGSASISGKTWYRNSGLPGAQGDYAGTWEGNDAFIVLDDLGNGISLFSEPPTPPEFLGYGPEEFVAFVDAALVLDPLNTSLPLPESYAVSPPLPDGLSLDPVTGVISGTPTTSAAPTEYEVTAGYPGGWPDIAITFTLEVWFGFFDGFEGRAGFLDADPLWTTIGLGNGINDFQFAAAGGNPGQRLNAPAGFQAIATVDGLDNAAFDNDSFVSCDVLIVADSTLGGPAMAVQDVSSYYTFQLSDGTGGGGTNELVFALWYFGAPVNLLEVDTTALDPPIQVQFNRWYRLQSVYRAATRTFELALRDPEDNTILWTDSVMDATFDVGGFGLATEYGGPHRFDNFAVLNGPALLPYAQPQALYAAGFPIEPNTVGSINGTASGFSVSPPLPAGLNLDPGTGTISGTPAGASTAAVHLVTATIGGVEGFATVEIAVDLPGIVDYTPSEQVAYVAAPMTPMVPTLFGGLPAGFTIDPPLPAGVALDPSTGTISGVPTGPSPATEHTVSATYTGLPASTFAILLEVEPYQFTGYTYSPAVYTLNRSIAPNFPITAGPTPTGFSIVPALPPGLFLNTADGRISGTPTAAVGAASYTVTADYASVPSLQTVLNLAVAAPVLSPAVDVYWPFDAAPDDASGNNRHLTLENGAALQNDAGAGVIGGGGLGGSDVLGNLDGLGNRAVADGGNGGVPYTGILGGDPRTVSLWARGLAFADPHPGLVSWGNDANFRRYEIRLTAASDSPAGRIRVEIRGAALNYNTPLINDGNWHHVMVTLPDGSTNLGATRVFVNGRLIPQLPNANNIDTGTDTPSLVRLADSIATDVQRNFRGWMDDVAFFTDGAAGYPAAGDAASAALLHGLGRLGGIGIEQLLPAQHLWVDGGSAQIGGRTWHRIGGLPGEAGNYGGSLADGTGFIVVDDSGAGIAQFTSFAPLRIVGVSRVPEGFRLTWSSVAGASYSVVATGDLGLPIGGWTVVESGIEAVDSETSYTDTGAGFGARYYGVAQP